MNRRDDLLREIAEILMVQDNVNQQAATQIDKNVDMLNSLEDDFDSIIRLQEESLKLLIAKKNVEVEHNLDEISKVLSHEKDFEHLKIEVPDMHEDWLKNVELNRSYAQVHNIDLTDPFFQMFSNTEMVRICGEMIEKFDICELDKMDYAFAAASGLICGIIDVCLVGTIGTGTDRSYLQEKIDKVFDEIVSKYAIQEKIGQINNDRMKALKKHPENAKEINDKFNDLIKNARSMDKKQAISFLERKHKVSYDLAVNDKKKLIFDINTKEYVSLPWLNPDNHHLMSLAHEPSILGLIIGIIDQLTNTVTMIDPSSGKIRRLMVKQLNENDLPGNLKNYVINIAQNSNGSGNEIKKISDAASNWFGHVMSDIAGSSSSKGRGQGLPVPGWEVLQKLQFGNLPINGEEMNIAKASEWMFKNGLDVRAFTAEAIPVVVNEILIRIYWFFKQHLYYGKSIKESIPLANSRELSRLLLVAMSTFSTLDIGDAAIKGISKSKMGTFGWGTFLMTINIPGLLDLGFRSIQNIKNEVLHRRVVEDVLDNDVMDEWNRILG